MDGPVHPNEPWLPICIPNGANDKHQHQQHPDDRSRIVVNCLNQNNKDIGGHDTLETDIVQQHQQQHHSPSTDHSTYTQLKNICGGVNNDQPNSQVCMMKSSDVDIIGLGEQKQHHHVKNLRPHSTPATLLWLEENYETAEGVCIPRSTLYMHYVDFCDRNGMQPVNAASFGKIIRQQFPHLTTRRLGTRGQSRYHYYGIAVKESSPYYDVSYSKRGGNSLHESKKEPIKQTATYSQRTKIGALLPDFTHFKDLNLPPDIPEEKVSTFLMMYRTHCQRILDTVIRASFDEVQSFLLHFWKGMPSHIASILGTNALVNVVGVCDSFVYKAISNVLFPSVHQALPDSLIQLIRKFSKELTVWLRMALDDVPENLRELKLDLAKCFSRTLRRQTSLNHLCQASRMVIHNADITGQMLHDWRHVDMDGVSRQTLFTVHDDGPTSTQTDMDIDRSGTGATVELITSLYKEFETLLEDQAPIEAYMEWLDSLIERCVVQPSRKRKSSIRRLARQFLLMWSCFGTRVIRDMTLHSAPSFGSFHLLHLTFDDYVLFLVESVHWEERTQELFANIPTDTPPLLNDSMIDDSIVDSEVGMCKLKWFSPQSNVSGGVGDHVITIPNASSQLSNVSPSHSRASSSDVIVLNSPGHQSGLDSSMTMTDDVKPPETPAGEMDPLIAEYTPISGDQYHSSYHGYQTHDTRQIFAYNAGVSSGRHVDTRSTYSSCHPGNQYIMNNPIADSQQVVDCVGSRNLTTGNASRSNGDTIVNGSNVEYVNFVQYPSGRRDDYADCHGYVYDQAPPPPPPPASQAPSIIYAPANCYYQPYDGNNVAAVTGNGSSTSLIGCCSPRYSVTPRGDDTANPGKLERLQETKLQDETAMSGINEYSTSGHINNGRV